MSMHAGAEGNYRGPRPLFWGQAEANGRTDMKVALLGLATLATIAAVSAATATQDPIQTRKKLMDANGAAAGLAFGMYSGKIPFNADAATAACRPSIR